MYFIIYKDNRAEWRWTFRAANHEAIAVSSEGYARREGALNGIALVQTGAPTAKIFDDQQKSWL